MRRTLVLASGLLLLPACSWTPSEPYTADTHPDVRAEDLGCVVVLSHDEPGTGSGIVIRPDVVLTANFAAEERGGFPARSLSVAGLELEESVYRVESLPSGRNP